MSFFSEVNGESRADLRGWGGAGGVGSCCPPRREARGENSESCPRYSLSAFWGREEGGRERGADDWRECEEKEGTVERE